MNERMKKQNQEVLKEKWEIAEYIDEEGNYVKVKYRKTEAYRFFLRFCSEWFHPCPSCQQKLKQLISNSKNMILGNEKYDPPIELNIERDVTDDKSFETLEEHKATEEEKKRLGDNWVYQDA